VQAIDRLEELGGDLLLGYGHHGCPRRNRSGVPGAPINANHTTRGSEEDGNDMGAGRRGRYQPTHGRRGPARGNDRFGAPSGYTRHAPCQFPLNNGKGCNRVCVIRETTFQAITVIFDTTHRHGRSPSRRDR
jgi:hypothetical protein